MTFLSRLLGRETRAETVTASDPALAAFLGDRTGLVGSVDAQRAAGLATAYACIRTIAENLSAVPLRLYRRTGEGGREVARDHPLHAVLQAETAPGLPAFAAREYLLACLCIYGNAYARIEWSGRGQVIALHPLDPQAVAVERLGSARRPIHSAKGLR